MFLFAIRQNKQQHIGKQCKRAKDDSQGYVSFARRSGETQLFGHVDALQGRIALSGSTCPFPCIIAFIGRCGMRARVELFCRPLICQIFAILPYYCGVCEVALPSRVPSDGEKQSLQRRRCPADNLKGPTGGLNPRVFSTTPQGGICFDGLRRA